MTQTTQQTSQQQAGETAQPTTTQPAETTQQTAQQATTAPQPEQTAQQTTSPQQTSQQPAKSAFFSDGKLPQSKPQPQQAEATNKPASNDDSDLKAQLTALQARLDAIESQRTTETRTAEVERIIAPLSETLKAVYRRTPFATLTDEEYAQLTETIKKEVTELATADKAPRGAVFSRPTASKPTDGKASDKETNEVIRRLNL